jgi:hypothetical protein
VPQLEQGFLHPQVLSGTGNPQRMQLGGAAGLRGRGTVDPAPRVCRSNRGSSGWGRPAASLPRCPALPKPIRSREERIGEPLNADRGIGAMATVDHRAVRQREELGLDAGQQRR